jgi:hypothetical protein
MHVLNFVKEYQSLAGSFLAVIFSIGLWYAKEVFEKRKEIRSNKEEVKNIFLMATRESEDAIKDVRMYVTEASKVLTEKKEKINISLPPKFNRIYINEERLFSLKNNLDFILAQQIDIAVSSAKKFNGYLDNFEFMPKFIFDGTMRLIETGVSTKEGALKDYKRDQTKNLDKMETLMNDEMLTVQMHLFRPIVAQSPKYLNVPEGIDVDKELDAETTLLVMAMKHDLA